MEPCTGTANVTGPPRDQWHPSVIPHGGKKKSFCGIFNDPEQSGPWCFFLGVTELTTAPEPAKAFLAGIDQEHLDIIHHLSK